jgi:hypothetical protein
VKTPLPVLALVGTTAVIGIRRAMSGIRSTTLYETAPLWSLIFVYSLSSIFSTLNIGHRHILPLYPAMFVLCGSAAAWLRSERLSLRWLLAAILCLFLIESGRAYPHYLAYFNQITGRTHAYRHLVDSSLDWGQDLPGLKRWLSDHGWDGSPQHRVYLTYFGTGDPHYYEIQASLLPVDRFPSDAPQFRPGLYCVSATALQCVYARAQGPWTDRYEAWYRDLSKHLERARRMPIAEATKEIGGADKLQQLAWSHYMLSVARLMAYLRQIEPIDSVGFSILVFKLSQNDLNRAFNEPLGTLQPGDSR